MNYNLIKKTLLSFRLIKLTIEKVEKWTDKRKVDELEYALQYGMYNVRKKAIEGLCKIESSSSIPLIIEKIDDNIKIVSYAAISAIEKFDATSELKERIRDKKVFWKEKELKDKKAAMDFMTRKSVGKYNWERPSKETLENVKQMLKRPMIGGKWF